MTGKKGGKMTGARFAAANAARTAVADTRRAAVAELRAAGLTFTAIAIRIGFSEQRASGSWVELKTRYADAMAAGNDDPAAGLGLSARAGSAVFAAICAGLGESVTA